MLARSGALEIALALVCVGCVAGVACAPAVDAPADHQRAIDRADGDQLAAELAALPGAVTAQVTLHRPFRDPLGTAPPTAASAAAVVIVDDAADRTALAATARQLAHAAAPEIADAATTIVVEIGAHRAELSRVGPFTVEASSRGPLRAALAAALAAIAMLAGWIAWRERGGIGRR